MTSIELIYLISISVIAVYAIVLTILLAVMNKRVKKAQNLLEEKIQKNADNIQSTDEKIDKSIADVDDKINRERENNEKKINEVFDNALTATNMLIDEKTKYLSDKMDDISLKLNIMDSTVKNIEREKVMIHSLLTDGDEPVEVQYHDVPKDSFLNNARKVVHNVAKTGSNFMNNIKKNIPGMAKTAIKIIKK